MNAEKITDAISKTRQFEELCPRFEENAYSNLDNNRLMAFTISFLTEIGIVTSQENLTAASFLMFPLKFALVGFPEYPDAERVNRSLLQLGPKYRNWATGNKHIGYKLTDKGISVVEEAKRLMKNPEPLTKRRSTPERTRDPEKEIREIEESKLFQEFKAGISPTNELDRFAIWELLRAFPSSPRRTLISRMKQMKESAKLGEREDILDFLKVVEATHKDLFKLEERK
jgi:hypothetical protein